MTTQPADAILCSDSAAADRVLEGGRSRPALGDVLIEERRARRVWGDPAAHDAAAFGAFFGRPVSPGRDRARPASAA